MDLLEALAAAPTRSYAGPGINHEGEVFTGRLDVEWLVDMRAAMLHYTAVRVGGDPREPALRREATLLARDPQCGLCLWPVMEELPFVLPHRQIDRTVEADGSLVLVFSTGPREAVEAFREEIVVALHPHGSLTYAHRWGMPGAGFGDRSSCRLAAIPTHTSD